ncbi:hypothetical protein RRG08_058218 [Elysia crispata]|uniref:Uncharacterized protein n=1 Tax=Elysia crispata TaxID=231223 RepID=A0AAE1DTK1_9GAST|nr:hypothetical protein RRG08_058218 [Elysia crispata]
MINNRCSDTDSHKELNPAEKEVVKEECKKTLQAFSAFINPFEVEDGLVSLASGLKVQEDVADDLLFGTSTTVSRNDCLKLESFVCKLYGKTSFDKYVDKARHDIDELHDIVTEEICTRTDEETYDDDSFDSDFLDDSSEDEEDIATDDEDGV